MRLRQGKVPPATLAILAAIAVAGYALVEKAKVDVKEKWYREKKTAAERTKQGHAVIREARKKAGLDINYDNDPEHTGLIGADDQTGPLTTDKGYLRAKQTSTNPNLAAVIVSLLKEAGVGKGDLVAVAMTGSFPGANLAVICAIETLEAKPVVITSVGSSTFGANYAEFTWLDMEKALFDAGTIRTRSIAASVGGDKDKGVGLNKATIGMIDGAIQRNGVEKIAAKTLVESIKRRMDLYEKAAKGKPYRCYVNIGGGLASVGSNRVGDKLIDTGLTTAYVVKNYPTEGVMLKMLKKGVPVVHLMDFRKLAEEHGLPRRQAAAGEVGEGRLFISKRYNLVLVIGTLVVLALLVATAVRLDLKHTFFRKPVPSPAQPPVVPGGGKPPDPGEPVL
ncbi:MAG: poly-gamma-glutamate system protein [Planctomycetes bacterium]|nr:poly-gamma-glutamate system protein [Planctomycetota bacterium]